MARAEDLDWNDLRLFVAAARAGSLAGAARALGVEHSTVGRRLRSLERALGGSLMLRKPDGLVLTPFGERVVAAAQQVDRAVANVLDVAGAQHERVRLTVPSGFVALFTPHLQRLRTATPPIALELISGARVMDLARGEADLAVRGGPVHELDLVARRLCDIGWSLYGAPDYLRRRPPNLDPTDLTGHDVIGFDPALAESPNARWIDARTAAANVVLRGHDIVDLVGAAAAGAGLALLPCYLAEQSNGLVRLTREVLARREMWLVYRREVRASAAVAAVIAFTIDVMNEAAAMLLGEPPPQGAATTPAAPAPRSADAR